MKLHVPAATQHTRHKRQSMKAQLHHSNKVAASVGGREANRWTTWL